MLQCLVTCGRFFWRKSGQHLGLSFIIDTAGLSTTARVRGPLFLLHYAYYTGFKVDSGEYKVMGLTLYGEPKYKELILDNDRSKGGRLVPA
jgi:hypothetical protein